MFRKFAVVMTILASLSLFITFTSVQAQGTNQSTNTPTPNETVAALETQVQALSTQVAYMEKQLDLKEQALQLDAKKELIPFYVVSVFIALAGLSSPYVVYKYLAGKFQKQLDQAIYHADPTYFPIYFPSVGFDHEKKRLQSLGFKNLHPYASLTQQQLSGVVIYAARDLGDIETLADFIKDKKADSAKVAFVIYTSGPIKGGVEAMEPFDGFSFANHPVTIASQIYALVRGMKQ